jgi:glutamate---cysteine ligase / carboxylate-amine ligase
MCLRKIGVEEELLLVDPDTLMLKPVSERAIRLHEPGRTEQDLQHELFLQQVESATEPCSDVESLVRALRAARRTASKAAQDAGATAVAVGTPVLWDTEGDVTPDDRYRRMIRTYGAIGRQSLVCGMHVHVDIASDEEAVGVIDHMRPWIPVLMAIAVNTPFHQGIDTGYASWRAHVWGSWPSAGPVEPFGGYDCYRAVTDDMVTFGAAMDEGMIYFDVRRSRSYPTVEVRVCDVCTDVEVAALVAVLIRALVMTTARDWSTGRPLANWRVELLRAARWRASRYGLTERLVDPASKELRPAPDAMRSLVRYVADALDESGDGPYVTQGIERLVVAGSGADRQRAVASRYGRLSAVVEDLLRRTGQDPHSSDRD